MNKLTWAVTKFRTQVEAARIRVIKRGRLAQREHEIHLNLMLRVPYMCIGTDHKYMPLDSGDVVRVEIGEEEQG